MDLPSKDGNQIVGSPSNETSNYVVTLDPFSMLGALLNATANKFLCPGRKISVAKNYINNYCERSEQHPILAAIISIYVGRTFSDSLNYEPRFCAVSLAFVLLNNTMCVTACGTTCILSRSRQPVLLWRTFAVWLISLSIW